jgi:hypothetical protein
VNKKKNLSNEKYCHIFTQTVFHQYQDPITVSFRRSVDISKINKKHTSDVHRKKKVAAKDTSIQNIVRPSK